MIHTFLEAEMNIESALKDIKDELKSKYNFEAALSKSNLGGGEPTYFLKVFGPKNSWGA